MENRVYGIISEIKRFAVHDGDGIRTTVFLKGCPLKCLWCHNPEGLDFESQMAYYGNKCISCGECLSVCDKGAHKIVDGRHVFDRALCISCGKCEKECLGSAMILYGRKISADELLPKLLEDRDFYETSGGGVTLSGGECLMQGDFCEEILRLCKENSLNTAVDTCGYVKREVLDKVIPYTDTFLYDVKAYSEETHIKCTGRSNKIILENLFYLDSRGKRIEVRIPYVPDYNSHEMGDIAEMLSKIKNLVRVRLLPYHNYAGTKYKSLDIENTLPEKMPEESETEGAKAFFREKNIEVI